tara:strand:- start:665 stop:811 length:147 start_codon:yes stop_codon:yes gene_type:complete
MKKGIQNLLAYELFPEGDRVQGSLFVCRWCFWMAVVIIVFRGFLGIGG